MILIPLVVAVVLVSLTLWLANWLLLSRHPELGNERRFSRQIGMLALTVAGLIAIILTLPVDASTRNQIIGLVGLLLSGVVAFSSTNIVANLMAGLMLRMTRSFRTGDYIRIEEQFGRVAERGLFDTEIQTETRELISVPNTYLISRPHTVVRASGTIVSTSLSLGYDVHHSRIEELLPKAAEQCGLSDCFVHILELGDFSITYRVSGLLTDVKKLLTTRSNLRRSVLDVLHEANIEIVSPAFMNQRPIIDGTKFIPARYRKSVATPVPIAEEIAFDKAEQAEQLETQRHELEKEISDLEARLKEAVDDDKQALSDEIEQVRQELSQLGAQAKNNSQEA